MHEDDELARAMRAARSNFVASLDERIRGLKAAVPEWAAGIPEAADAVAGIAHAIHGTGGTLGFLELSQAAARIEELARAGDSIGAGQVEVLLGTLAYHAAKAAGGEGPDAPEASLEPHRRTVVLILPPARLRENLAPALDHLGFAVLTYDSDQQAIGIFNGERLIDRIVFGPGDHGSLIAHLRRSALIAPLLVQLSHPADLVASASAGEAHGPYDARLSFALPPEALARAIGELSNRRARRPRILGVDDEQPVLDAFAAVLGPTGVDFTPLSAGEDTLRTVAACEPDLVILDVDMPRLNGFDVLAALRAEPRWQHLAVVLMTARNAVADRIQAYDLGADDFITKPVDPAEFRSRVLARLRRSLLLRASLDHDPSSGLLSTTAFARAVTRLLADGVERPTTVALIQSARPDIALSALAEQLGSGLSPGALIGTWDARTLAVALPNADASAAQTIIGKAFARFDLAGIEIACNDNARTREARAAALILGAEVELGKRHSVETPAQASGRILIADDDPMMRALLARLLEGRGFKVDVVGDGVEATARLEKAVQEGTPYQIAVLDVHMPRRSGFQVLQELARISKHTRALILSAQSRDEDVVRALKIGAADFVPKPFSAPKLLARIEQLARAPG